MRGAAASSSGRGGRRGAPAAAASGSAAAGAGGAGGAGGDRQKREVVVSGFEKKGLKRKLAEQLEQGALQVACPRGEPLLEGSEAYKAYKNQYKRLCTHLRRNDALAKRLESGELAAERVASMGDEALMADAQRSEREQFQRESLHEALGQLSSDSAHWTPTDNFTCPKCECLKCIYIQTFKGSHGYDDNNIEPAITIRCTDCHHLWKEEDEEGGRLATGSFTIDTPAVPSENEASRAGGAKKAEAPSLWHEEEGRRAPTWLLPAKD